MAAKKVKSIITGDKEIDAMMAKLEKKVQTKIVRDALKSGMQPMLQAAISKAPRDENKLAKRIKIRAGKRSRGYIRRSIVVLAKDFPAESAKDKSKPQFYPAFVEYGLGSGEENYPRQPYLRPAFDETSDYVRGHVMREIRDKLIAATKGG